MTFSNWIELWAPEIKSFPISKKGTPLIFFSLAVDIFEFTFWILSSLIQSLKSFSWISNSLAIFTKILISPISRPSIKYDWYIFSLISFAKLNCSLKILRNWEKKVFGVVFI